MDENYSRFGFIYRFSGLYSESRIAGGVIEVERSRRHESGIETKSFSEVYATCQSKNGIPNGRPTSDIPDGYSPTSQ
jgi:hypothetical protein